MDGWMYLYSLNLAIFPVSSASFRPDTDASLCRVAVLQVMELKVRVLTIVASPANYAAIIKELAAVVGPYNSQLSRLATRAIGQIAIKVCLSPSL
jgi:hypothetical protein